MFANQVKSSSLCNCSMLTTGDVCTCTLSHDRTNGRDVRVASAAQNVPESRVWTINTGYRASLSQLVCSIKVHNHQMNPETSARAERSVHVSRPPSCLTRQHRRTRKHSTDDHEEQIQAGSVLPPCDLDMHAHCCS